MLFIFLLIQENSANNSHHHHREDIEVVRRRCSRLPLDVCDDRAGGSKLRGACEADLHSGQEAARLDAGVRAPSSVPGDLNGPPATLDGCEREKSFFTESLSRNLHILE